MQTTLRYSMSKMPVASDHTHAWMVYDHVAGVIIETDLNQDEADCLIDDLTREDPEEEDEDYDPYSDTSSPQSLLRWHHGRV